MMNFARTAMVALSLAALGSATMARAAQDACLTPAELDAIFAYSMPTVIDAAGQACRPVLAPDGFLATQGTDLSARYRVAQPAAWPQAKSAVLKLGMGAVTGHGGGLGKFAGLLPDSALQGFVTGFVSQFVVHAIHPGDCPDIEYAMRMAAPLPPENAAGLVTLVVSRVERPRPGHKPDLPICTAQPVPPVATPPEH